ncbi:MAG: BamA/TamA family outer membrane protein [Bryobacterales bacterium]|nr:BamA/TamA family outer membrane protein [Bryobacterales bacterium]
MLSFVTVLFLSLLTLAAAAQQPQTRAELIDQEHEAKQKTLEPDIQSKWERRLLFIKDARLIERLAIGYAGLSGQIGGMPTGSGFALGPDYFRDDLVRGQVHFEATTQASLRKWYNGQVRLSAPAFARNKLAWSVAAVHHNYSSLDYYGPGPDSEKTGRSNYRLEDTSFDMLFGVRPVKKLLIGGSLGYVMTNVGPGVHSQRISSAEQHPQVAGMLEQTNYLRRGFNAQFDYRDTPAGARSGGNYTIRWDDFQDMLGRAYDFQRLEMEAQQYIPILNKRRVFALRARTQQTFNPKGNRVPFYQQSVLGGDDLRGFRPYRFYDANMHAFSAEYRWEVFSGLDMAVFADAGQVQSKHWRLKMNEMESAVGFGFRFNAKNTPFLRLDVGFSHEGFQIWVRFREIWQQRPRGSSSAPHIF